MHYHTYLVHSKLFFIHNNLTHLEFSQCKPYNKQIHSAKHTKLFRFQLVSFFGQISLLKQHTCTYLITKVYCTSGLSKLCPVKTKLAMPILNYRKKNSGEVAISLLQDIILLGGYNFLKSFRCVVWYRPGGVMRVLLCSLHHPTGWIWGLAASHLGEKKITHFFRHPIMLIKQYILKSIKKI